MPDQLTIERDSTDMTEEAVAEDELDVLVDKEEYVAEAQRESRKHRKKKNSDDGLLNRAATRVKNWVGRQRKPTTGEIKQVYHTPNGIRLVVDFDEDTFTQDFKLPNNPGDCDIESYTILHLLEHCGIHDGRFLNLRGESVKVESYKGEPEISIPKKHNRISRALFKLVHLGRSFRMVRRKHYRKKPTYKLSRRGEGFAWIIGGPILIGIGFLFQFAAFAASEVFIPTVSALLALGALLFFLVGSVVTMFGAFFILIMFMIYGVELSSKSKDYFKKNIWPF